MSRDAARASLLVIAVTPKTLVDRGVPRRTAYRLVAETIRSGAWEVVEVEVVGGHGARQRATAVRVPPAVLEAAVAPWQSAGSSASTAL